MDVESLSRFWTFLYIDFGYIGLLSDSENFRQLYLISMRNLYPREITRSTPCGYQNLAIIIRELGTVRNKDKCSAL